MEKQNYENFIKSLSKDYKDIMNRLVLFAGRKDNKTTVKEIDIKNILLSLLCVCIEDYIDSFDKNGENEGIITIPMIGSIVIKYKNIGVEKKRKGEKYNVDFDYHFVPDNFLEKNLQAIYNKDFLEIQKILLGQINFEMENKLDDKKK